MNKLLLTVFFSFLICSLSAEQVIIQGRIKNFDNKSISLNQYQDYISFNKEKLQEQKIQNGQFSFAFDLEETKQIILKIEDKETSFFAEPNGIYNIELTYDIEQNRGKSFDKLLDINFILPRADEANSLIRKFNATYQNFISDHLPQFAIKTAGREIDAFIEKMENDPIYQQQKFVKSYVEYALASLRNINREPQADLFNAYFANKPIQYSNKEYMNFFRQFFQHDFEQLTINKKGQALLKTITFDKKRRNAIEEIKKAKGMQSDPLAELYLIYGLYEVYYTKRVNQEASIEMLNQIQQEGFSPENKKIAENILMKLQLSNSSNKAPEFQLKDQKGKLHALKDFSGKPIYLNFWSTWSIPSIKELQIINILYEKYGKDVHFISINLDEDETEMKNTLARYPFAWTFLHYGNDYEIREKYEAVTVPSYYLIDKDGLLKISFAPGPLEIESELKKLLR